MKKKNKKNKVHRDAKVKADGKGAVIGERSRERSVIDMLGHWLKMRNTIQERHE